MDNTQKINLALSFAVVGAALCIISPDIFSEGLFMDGLIYATIAKNLSLGIGSFWTPQFTATYDAEFYGHPPLAFGLQSLFFRLFGTGVRLEKVYSILTYVATGTLFLVFLRQNTQRYGGLFLLFWCSVPQVLWASYSNLLENTLLFFTSAAMLLYLQTFRRAWWWVVPCGFLLVLGFLTKGFVAFFVWSVPFWLWVVGIEPSFRRSFVRVLGFVAATLLPLFALGAFSAAARNNLTHYLDLQVIGSLQHAKTVSWRGFIVVKLFSELSPALLLTGILHFWSHSKGHQIPPQTYRLAAVYALVGLSGSLPIMLSLKQSGFYLLPVFPIFALCFATLNAPLLPFLFKKIRLSPKIIRTSLALGISIFALGAFLSLRNADTIHRDRSKIKDCHLILTQLNTGDTISIAPAFANDWSLYGYYGRYKTVNLDTDNTVQHRFLLTYKNDIPKDSLLYAPVPLATEQYALWERRIWVEGRKSNEF